MYIRDAKNREEVWLLDRLDEFGFEDPAFRSRDYVLATDEETGDKTGFGRLRVHSMPEEERGDACELTCIGVLPDYRGQGVGAHVLERLVEMARDQGFEKVYSITETDEFCRQFGFEQTRPEDLPSKLADRLDRVREQEPDAEAVSIEVSSFEMPPRLRRRFHDDVDAEAETSEQAEDFGIDPDTATYKYDTGGE